MQFCLYHILPLSLSMEFSSCGLDHKIELLVLLLCVVWIGLQSVGRSQMSVQTGRVWYCSTSKEAKGMSVSMCIWFLFVLYCIFHFCRLLLGLRLCVDL